MTAPWLIVTGDFTTRGGMDVANHALAGYLASRGGVDLVAHRVQDDLCRTPGVRIALARRPFGRHILGAPLLDRLGRREAVRVAAAGGRVVVNGGNCRWPDVNWVHYVHAAFDPTPPRRLVRALKSRWSRRTALRREREVIAASRVVVCNSRLTARHVVERLGVAERRARVVYYGCDPATLPAVTAAEKAAARAALGYGGEPLAIFVGALGDSRKGFDTLYAAWEQLCSRPGWDARLLVAGTGASLPDWQARAAADGLGDRVLFLGFRDDVPRLLAAADLMIHPARYEAYGLGVHEALCRGLPALVTHSAGVAEQYPVDLAELLIQNPDDPGELVERLRLWRADVAGWAARVAPFADRLRSRTWADMAADFVRAVEETDP